MTAIIGYWRQGILALGCDDGSEAWPNPALPGPRFDKAITLAPELWRVCSMATHVQDALRLYLRANPLRTGEPLEALCTRLTFALWQMHSA